MVIPSIIMESSVSNEDRAIDQEELPNDFDVEDSKSDEPSTVSQNSNSKKRVAIGVISIFVAIGFFALGIFVLHEANRTGNGGLVIAGFFALVCTFFPIGVAIYQCIAK
jgi:hypothetical protein